MKKPLPISLLPAHVYPSYSELIFKEKKAFDDRMKKLSNPERAKMYQFVTDTLRLARIQEDVKISNFETGLNIFITLSEGTLFAPYYYRLLTPVIEKIGREPGVYCSSMFKQIVCTWHLNPGDPDKRMDLTFAFSLPNAGLPDVRIASVPREYTSYDYLYEFIDPRLEKHSNLKV